MDCCTVVGLTDAWWHPFSVIVPSGGLQSPTLALTRGLVPDAISPSRVTVTQLKLALSGGVRRRRLLTLVPHRFMGPNRRVVLSLIVLLSG